MSYFFFSVGGGGGEVSETAIFLLTDFLLSNIPYVDNLRRELLPPLHVIPYVVLGSMSSS